MSHLKKKDRKKEGKVRRGGEGKREKKEREKRVKEPQSDFRVSELTYSKSRAYPTK